MRKLILVFLLGCAACTTQAQDPLRQRAPSPNAPSATAPSDTLGSLRALVGDAACSDSAQCRTLPLGARACGGPEAYLAYSTAKGSEAQLRSLAERYQAERRAANKASGMMSTCQFMPDPGAVCQAGRCQLGTGEALAR
ncbi:hypothetical protein [Massilia alkalitolerans]|jgi:hypothetical protein|uniref:hypothetical protein n=1 Tax=Massilia alkalitolerans TaxID=286638 RepID=UPI00040B913A|nr:hypothetical protein [Massilia alkalitolerans]